MDEEGYTLSLDESFGESFDDFPDIDTGTDEDLGFDDLSFGFEEEVSALASSAPTADLATKPEPPQSPRPPSGLPLHLSHLEHKNAPELAEVTSTLSNPSSFHAAYFGNLLQAEMVDQLYSEHADLGSISLEVEGPNHVSLPYDAFMQSQNKPCSGKAYQRRIDLKKQRTLLNLESLKQSYPNDFQIDDLINEVQSIDTSLAPNVLRQQLLALSKTQPFQHYVEVKEQFVEDAIAQRYPEHRSHVWGSFDTPDLQELMKALLQQKDFLQQHYELIRYKDLKRFRPFNARKHPEVHSDTLSFWKTEGMRDEFKKFMYSLFESFPDGRNFYVFRFAKSFTYLLCGFADDSLVNSLQHEWDNAEVHAKVIMRQTDGSFRELLGAEYANEPLYHNCLKTAMRPFIHQINHGLEFELSNEFLAFFEV